MWIWWIIQRRQNRQRRKSGFDQAQRYESKREKKCGELLPGMPFGEPLFSTRIQITLPLGRCTAGFGRSRDRTIFHFLQATRPTSYGLESCKPFKKRFFVNQEWD